MEIVCCGLLLMLVACAVASSDAEDPHQLRIRRQGGQISEGVCHVTDEACGVGSEDFSMSTISDCCLGRGLSFFNSSAGTCQVCIVIGWLESGARFRATETGESVTINVGLVKPETIEDTYRFMVETTDITAVEGVDYSIINGRPIIGPGASTDEIQVILRADGVALEGLETAELTLRPQAQLPDNVFLAPDMLQLEIQDVDILRVSFSEVDYRLDREDTGFIVVTVVVSSTLASSLTVRVTPLEVPEFEARRSELIGEFPGVFNILPEDNANRPPYATAGLDFDDSSIEMTLSRGGDHLISIPITPDSINEAEQAFVIQLSVLGNFSEANVDADFSLCTVVDDDSIFLSWVQPEFTFPEGTLPNEIIPIIKENSTTEQLLLASIRLVSTPLTEGTSEADPVDFFFGEIRGTVRFLTRFESQNDFAIILFADSSFEGEEVFSLAFQNNEGAGGLGGAAFSFGRYPITTIHIRDEIVIGFNQTFFNVSEGAGSVELCVEVQGRRNPPLRIVQLFSLVLNTTEGTADVADFFEISPFDTSFEGFLSASGTASQCVQIGIREDSIVEPPEEFSVILSLSANDSRLSNIVTISPAVAVIRIIDSSGEGVIIVNDTAIGDPLLTVPLMITNLEGLGLDSTLSLCYEVHGRSNAHFNLISDSCVSVSAHYVAAGPFNVINRVAVRAVDAAGSCRDILVDADNACSAEVDGTSLQAFSEAEVSVRRFAERVRISVPNCDKQQLVMWVLCENGSLRSYNSDSNGTVFEARMIKFVVARGFNLQETSHGIIGQFWNIPVIAEPFNGTMLNGEPAVGYFKVSVSHPDSSTRNFPGFFWPLTWERRSEPCLYAGSNHAGGVNIIEGLQDTIIEGLYTDYIVDGAFDTEFKFSRFSDGFCN